MKAFLGALVVSLLVPALARADERVVEATRDVSPFEGVAVSAGIQAKLVEGPHGPIGVRGEESAVAHLKLEVKDGVLQIGYDKNDLRMKSPTQLAIRMPRAKSLSVSGGARIEASVPTPGELGLAASGGGGLRVANTVKPKQVAISASGGAIISVAGVETSDATIDLSGAAKVSLAGQAGSVTLAMSGGAELDAAGLKVGSVQVAGSGGAVATIRAARASGALASGSSLRVPASSQIGNVVQASGASIKKDL